MLATSTLFRGLALTNFSMQPPERLDDRRNGFPAAHEQVDDSKCS
jgi:hypothetical protein